MIPDAHAATPPLMWQQVVSVRVLCLLQPHTLPERRQLESQLCDRVVTLASEGATLPVSAVGFGDPAVIEPDTLTLLVHGSIQPDEDGRLLVLDIRPFRAAREQSALLFGPPPRAVRLSDSGRLGETADGALRAALAEILPWGQAR